MAKKFIGEAEKAKYIQEFREALMECGGATGLFYMVDTAQGLCAGLKVQGLGTLGNYIMEVLGAPARWQTRTISEACAKLCQKISRNCRRGSAK